MHGRVEQQEATLQDMMERLGVDTLGLARQENGGVYARARATCLFCAASSTCRQWLNNSAIEPATPNYCPNLALLLAHQLQDRI
ncbi:MAG: DUF6455 family protein [Hyphomicrobiaceae bacterium]